MNMRIEDLSKKAEELQKSGMTTGQIADELNLSSETIVWLLTNKNPVASDIMPKDISIDWSSLGKNATRLRSAAVVLCDMALELDEEIDAVVGVSTSGVPVAGFMADELGCDFSVYYSKKGKVGTGESKNLKGTFSRNFGEVRGKNCLIVDDVITTGNTIKDVISQLKLSRAKPVVVTVLVDKIGVEEIEAVPIKSMFRITRFG